jgi:DNA polymerase sigma
VYLKLNNLTGKGMLDSMTYMWMLVSFLQKQRHLDLAQGCRLSEKVLETNEEGALDTKVYDERLTLKMK